MKHTPAERYLRDYVAIPSVNPMGRSDLPAEIAGERRYAEHLREQLRRIGLDAEIFGDPDRPSVLAEARVSGARSTLLIASHLDTVPVDHMEVAPFEPVVDAGRLYGRGSCDTKAGMACAVAALERVLETGRLRRDVILVGESDEELGSTGARDLIPRLDALRPDWAIATEPTGLRVVTQHKGIAIVRLVARGESGHSSMPDAGRNAIYTLARAVTALEALADDLRRNADPVLGPATLSVGVVGGGAAPNMIPDEAWLLTDRRLLPGEGADQVRAEIEARLAEHGVEDVEVVRCRVEKEPLRTPEGHPAVRALQQALEAHGLPAQPDAVSFGTDAGILAAAGLPGVVFGPGSIDRAHTTREYVELSQVEAATEIFARLFETP